MIKPGQRWKWENEEKPEYNAIVELIKYDGEYWVGRCVKANISAWQLEMVDQTMVGKDAGWIYLEGQDAPEK